MTVDQPTDSHPDPDPGPRRLRFDGFELDLDTGELWREGEPVELAPQPTRLLVLLARRTGRLVTREQIEDELWGDAVVEIDAAINHAVREVREALGDDASHPRFIQTVPRRGYRFVADVESGSADVESGSADVESGSAGPAGLSDSAGSPGAAGASSSSSAPDSPSAPESSSPPDSPSAPESSSPPDSPSAPDSSGASTHRFTALVVTALVALLVLAAAWALVRPAQPETLTIAVVPVRSPTAGSDAERVAERLTAVLLASLRQLESDRIEVTRWSWTMSYDRERGRIVEDDEIVEADFALDANVTTQGDSLRIGVTLMRVADGVQVWYRAFSHPASDPTGAIDRVRERVMAVVEENLRE